MEDSSAFGHPHVLLIDDDQLLRDLLATLLDQSGCNVTCAADITAGRDILRGPDPVNLVILDYRTPRPASLAQLSGFLDAAEGVPVALLSSNLTLAFVRRIVELGFRGYLPKSIRPDTFVQAVRLILSGGVYIPEDVLLQSEKDRPLRDITPTEMDVLARVAAGQSNKLIAADLQMSESTVKMHIRSLSSKLRAHNRTQIALQAIRLGLAQAE